MHRIMTLFVRHGTERYADSLDTLLAQQARSFQGIEREVLVIDNTLPESSSGHASNLVQERLKHGVTVIGGSNSHWEFSAWDSGLTFLGSRINSFDWVHLVTSAYREHYNDYIPLCDAALLHGLRGRSLAVGHIDQYNDPVEFLGCISQSWIRTSYLFVRPYELTLLGSLVSIRDESLFFTDNPMAPFRADAPLGPAYQQNIIGWLTGAGTGQGTSWHSRFDLTSDTLQLFRAKTMSIINEHALTVRLRMQGCATLDATWAARQLTNGGLTNRDLPHWRDQISKRFIHI